MAYLIRAWKDQENFCAQMISSKREYENICTVIGVKIGCVTWIGHNPITGDESTEDNICKFTVKTTDSVLFERCCVPTSECERN